MRLVFVLFVMMSLCAMGGCETVHQTTKKAGTAVGKGARAAGGFTEGVAEGIKGEETSAENPYGR